MINFDSINDKNSVKRTVVARSKSSSPNKFRPAVDIIIPFYNHYESLTRCYAAVQNYTPNQDYKIILVDDNSSNADFLRQILYGRKKSIGVRNEINKGFAASVNEGIRAGTNPLICVMHSDVMPENIYWLYHLQEALGFGKDNNIKFVSSRLSSAGTCNDYPQELIYNETCDVESIICNVKKPLPFTCCLFNRQLIEKIGYLKEYPLAWYEDVEYCHRMRKNGYKQAIAMKSTVKHIGGVTVNPMIQDKLSNLSIMENNLHLCISDIQKLKLAKV